MMTSSNSNLRLSLSENEAATNLASLRAQTKSPSMRCVKMEDGLLRNGNNMKTENDASDSTEDEVGSLSPSSSSHNINRRQRKLNSSRWTPEEDEKLKLLVQQFGPKTWHLVAKHMSSDNDQENDQTDKTSDHHQYSSSSNHTAVQCMCRYKNVLDVCVRKGPWTEEEDEILRQLVEANAPGPHKIKWREVAEHLSGRLGKQCRERWFNQLDPSINMGPWKPDEDQTLLEAQLQFGNRWNQIAKTLEGRTENAVKNRFNSVSFKRWKDAVEGCLELDNSMTPGMSSSATSSSVSSSSVTSNSLDNSPKLQSMNMSSMLPLTLTPLDSGGGTHGSGLIQSPLVSGEQMNTSTSSSSTSSLISTQTSSFSLSNFHEQDSMDMLKLQRKRFRYSEEHTTQRNLSSTSTNNEDDNDDDNDEDNDEDGYEEWEESSDSNQAFKLSLKNDIHQNVDLISSVKLVLKPSCQNETINKNKNNISSPQQLDETMSDNVENKTVLMVPILTQCERSEEEVKLKLLKDKLEHVQSQRKDLKICEDELKRKIRSLRKQLPTASTACCSSSSSSTSTPAPNTHPRPL